MKILFILGAIALIILVIFIVQALWNWLIPELFKGPKIKFKHAFGLLVLCKILFGFGGGHGGNWQHHWGNQGMYGAGNNWNSWDHGSCAPYNSTPKDSVK